MTAADAISPDLHEAIARTASLEELYGLMQESAFLSISIMSDGREVYWDGDPANRIMIIVEEPQRGPPGTPPLTGEDGEMYESMLASIGLTRNDVFTVPLSPWPTPGGRALAAHEIAATLPFLRRHIALCNPAFLVLMGGNVARAVTGIQASGFELRQRWLEYDAGDIILPAKMLYHPGFLMKEVLQKEYAWADLLDIRRVIDGGDPYAERLLSDENASSSEI